MIFFFVSLILILIAQNYQKDYTKQERSGMGDTWIMKKMNDWIEQAGQFCRFGLALILETNYISFQTTISLFELNIFRYYIFFFVVKTEYN